MGIKSYIVLILVFLAGCGNKQVPTCEVSGFVTLDGKAVPGGVITFVPDHGPCASGVIENGRYTLTTRLHGDGAVAGRHRVFFGSKLKTSSPIVNGIEPAVLPKQSNTEFPPKKYLAPETSELTVEVLVGGNKFDFQLTN
jgi:hypothetical protein